ncbi:hypothetical protein JNW88_08185 [Micromonospora sp. ATA32]|nr:hypothetical protein [Micromonospora sp. ATA32]
MRHTEQTVADTISEPPNGARLVVLNHPMSEHDYRVIWRDDAEAEARAAQEGERWFDSDSDDPMSLYEHLKYAAQVFQLNSPIARFRAIDPYAREAAGRG